MTWNSNNEGRVIWITGLSGAGKSTIARATAEQLHGQGEFPVLLDGDAVRAAIHDPHIKHDPASRLANAYRICRLARLLTRQGHIVIVATMSIYHEIHSWNRRNYPYYFEVWVEADLDTLRKQDARKLYSRAQKGETKNVAGLDLNYEKPLNPDLIIINNPPLRNPEDLASKLLRAIQFETIKI